MGGKNCAYLVLHSYDLPRCDLYVRGLALGAAYRLVHMYRSVGKRISLSFLTSAQQYSCHTGSHTDADGGDLRPDQLHSVVYCQPGANDAARTIDVEADISFLILTFQEQELGNNNVGYLVVDSGAQEYNPLSQ